MTGVLPDKLYFKIGEVSKLTGVKSYVLRYWESEFPFLRPKKNQGGRRLYQKEDIALILKIKRMLYKEGLTIAGVRRSLLKRSPRTSAVELVEGIKKDLKEILKVLGT